MSNQNSRVEKLEVAHGVVKVHLTDDELAKRAAMVLANPEAAAAVIGADGVARVLELIEIARARPSSNSNGKAHIR